MSLLDKWRPAVAAAAILTCAAPAALAVEDLPPIPGAEDFGAAQVVWQGGIGRAYAYRLKLIDHNVRLALCGAGAYVNPLNGQQTRRLMRKAELKMDGKTILKDFGCVTRVASEDKLVGSPATCRLTKAATPRKQVEFGISHGKNTCRF